MNASVSTPVVMAMSGADPTGGAGIQADIETLAAIGCHAAPIITSITVQDTNNVIEALQIDEHIIIEQARIVLEDMNIAAIKIGLVGSEETARTIHSILTDYPHIPVVLDPVITAGGGKTLADDGVIEAISALLIPYATIVTPNSNEAKRLAPEADTLEACAMAILERGAHYVLVTGGHNKTQEIDNILYGNHRKLDTRNWYRLPYKYHGSGCTFAAAIAAYLAHGKNMISATYQAQKYTWKSLQTARQLGMGQKIPNRFHWFK